MENLLPTVRNTVSNTVSTAARELRRASSRIRSAAQLPTHETHRRWSVSEHSRPLLTFAPGTDPLATRPDLLEPFFLAAQTQYWPETVAGDLRILPVSDLPFSVLRRVYLSLNVRQAFPLNAFIDSMARTFDSVISDFTDHDSAEYESFKQAWLRTYQASNQMETLMDMPLLTAIASEFDTRVNDPAVLARLPSPADLEAYRKLILRTPCEPAEAALLLAD